jgi:hypothetical protein
MLGEPLLGQGEVTGVDGHDPQIAQDERGSAQLADLGGPGHALRVVRGGPVQVTLMQGEPAEAAQRTSRGPAGSASC